MEIGSIYEIAPDSVKECSKDDGKNFGQGGLAEIKKYNKKYCTYTASGREAIVLALKSLRQFRPNLTKSCLLPAYMCDTVFFPFEREGWDIHFYHVNKELEVDESKLRTQIEQIRPGLLFIHPYYGVDTWSSLRTMLAELKKQGICIMEDVTQSYYLKGVGAEADYVVGSLRKWYPVPDGGFVVSDEKLIDEGIEEDTEYAKKRLKILMNKWEYLYGSKDGQDEDKRKLDKEEYLKQNREMEDELDKYSGIRKISNEAACILKRINEDDAKKQRIDNYKFLYNALKDRMLIDGVLTGVTQNDKNKFVPIIPATEEIAPLYFAIYANNRNELQSFLAAHGIYAPVLWPIGKENADFLANDEKYIYEHMLALPIDQRYGREEMQHIVEVMAQDIIGIRADANEEVAMGHIMRCITIAKQLKKLGKRVCFFTADEYAAELLEQAGIEQICLHSKWNHMEDEIYVLREAIKRTGCSKLLVDSYYAGAEYFEKLSDLCKLIYIDDCFEGIYPVNMLINYNAYHVRFNYEEAYQKANQNRTRLLLGTAYVPLREEFRIQGNMEASVENNESVENTHVLISSGGGDAYNVLSGILNEAVKDEELGRVIFHTVVGRFNHNTKELKSLEEGNPNIKLHYDVKNMAELMEKCDAAVSAAGTMLFELSAMQVPSVFFVSADNQQFDSEFFAREERMLFAGDIRSDRNECIGNICSGLKKILKDEKLRKRMKEALHDVTDGKGAERIAKAIVSL